MGWLNLFSGKKSVNGASPRTSTARQAKVPQATARSQRRVLAVPLPATRAAGQSRSAASGTAVSKATALPSAPREVAKKSSAKAKSPSVAAKRPTKAAKAPHATGKARTSSGAKRGSKTVVSPTGNRISETATGTAIMTTLGGRKRFITKAKTPKGQKKTVHAYDQDALKKSSRKKPARKRKT